MLVFTGTWNGNRVTIQGLRGMGDAVASRFMPLELISELQRNKP